MIGVVTLQLVGTKFHVLLYDVFYAVNDNTPYK